MLGVLDFIKITIVKIEADFPLNLQEHLKSRSLQQLGRPTTRISCCKSAKPSRVTPVRPYAKYSDSQLFATQPAISASSEYLCENCFKSYNKLNQSLLN